VFCRSLQLHLETRFAQLKAAAQLELWQEAFRSIEDIHGLIQLSKRAPRPQMMAAYFEKLAHVFWKSGNYLV
jgi:translation initiation factor 3 subunit A